MKDIVFLKGQKVNLRALAPTDLNEKYLQWLNDEEVCEFNSHAVFPNTELKMKSYFERISGSQNEVVLAIVDGQKGNHIGNVSLQQINWVSRNAEFAILIGDKEYWRGGYGEEATRLIIDYGFSRLNLHRIYCGTINGNKGMMKLADKLNMKEEGRRREAIFKNGVYKDIIEYGLLKAEHRVNGASIK